jgi:glyoxylase-like metal-dependent hydrolase (beta-lactamase superfamily II)
MSDPKIFTIDLNFRNKNGTIGSYVIPHSAGCILIETGPGSTKDNLVAGLHKLGYDTRDITDVFLTHIHLDHAGAAGWVARLGARVHVHRNGAPHLINPEKLLTSAHRLYGDMMDSLWGEFFPVQEDKISIMADQEVTQIGDLSIRALDVPGHANHHLVYLVGDACFSGDIAGIRLSTLQYIRLPVPPPDFHLENWYASIQHILQFHPKRIIPTHFGQYPDADWHLNAILDELMALNVWMERTMNSNPTQEEFRCQFVEFEQMRAKICGVDKDSVEAQQVANPSSISADGIMRYWNKYRKSKLISS